MKRVHNRFMLVHLATKRVIQLRKGAKPLVEAPKNKEVVLALREIAAGSVDFASIAQMEQEAVSPPAQIEPVPVEAGGEETGSAPGEKTGSAPGDETVPAPEDETGSAPGEETVPAPEDETGSAPGEETGSAPGDEQEKEMLLHPEGEEGVGEEVDREESDTDTL
jgi:DNA-directed RNA polymerase subunit omega